jgi:hypothetical protein
MPFYSSSDQLYSALQILFSRIAEHDPGATRKVSDARLILRMRTSSPVTEVNINGRRYPIQAIYGASPLRPDIELELPADLLHGILLSEITMRKAYSTGKIKLRGPIWKAFVLENIFHAGQAIYPQVLIELNLDGDHPTSDQTDLDYLR